MKTIITRVLTPLAALASLAACATAPETVAESAPAQTPAAAQETAFAPALWAVRDADSTIYLYGTIHLRRPGEDWANDRVRAAIAESDEIWTEIEIPEVEDPAAMQPLVMRLGMAPAGQGLSTHLTAEQTKAMNEALATIGVPEGAFEPLRPWLAGITISVLQMTQAGFDPQAGVDRGVVTAARQAGKTLRWFETPEEQLNFLAGLSLPLQVQLLNDTVAELDQGVALLNRMDDAWNAGDTTMLEADIINRMRTEYPELYDVLLTQRNAAWVEVLSQELQGSGTDFVAVGVGHLVGSESVIAMLAARGIVAERIQ